MIFKVQNQPFILVFLLFLIIKKNNTLSVFSQKIPQI
jgi:hypothetical protein